MMKDFLSIVLALIFGMSIPVISLGADKPFVTINGTAVPQEAADMYMAQGRANGMSRGPELQSSVREELIRRELMFQEAMKLGIDKKPTIKTALDSERRKLMVQAKLVAQTIVVQAYVKDFIDKHPIGDVELKAGYETMKAKGGRTEYRIRQILVKNEADAQAIIAKLKQGVRFERMTEQSIDANSRLNGGNIGWSSPSKFVKPLADAIDHLQKGQYTQMPVKTDYGYYVIKVDDIRPMSPPSFDEMRPMLLKQAQEQMVDNMIQNLRAKAKIQ